MIMSLLCTHVIDYNLIFVVQLLVAMMLHVQVEFFIQVRPSTGNGTYGPQKLGHFTDQIFPQCNSYACCGQSNATNVARRCKDAPNAPNKPIFNKNFYTMTYSWHPPEGYKGPVLFISAFSQSNSDHWENIASKPIYIAIPPPPNTPPPKLTTTTQMPLTTPSEIASTQITVPSSSPTSASTSQETTIGPSTSTEGTSTVSTTNIITSTTESIITTNSLPKLYSTTKKAPVTTRDTVKPKTKKPTTLVPKRLTATTTKKLVTKRTTTTTKPVPKTKKPQKIPVHKLTTLAPMPLELLETTSQTPTEPSSTTLAGEVIAHRPGLILTPYHPYKPKPKTRRPGPELLPPPKLSNKKLAPKTSTKSKAAALSWEVESDETRSSEHVDNKVMHKPNVQKPQKITHQRQKNPYANDKHLGQTMQGNQQQQLPYSNVINPPTHATPVFSVNSGGAQMRDPHGFVLQASPYSASMYKV
ncbi:mucin-2 [Folsomia candida]|uniref:mucin-2 n=1 Tax=Folsomia candida TaxID=158441 RepID=UPI0016055905|nr:mucin-2 [Folsomia candida]